MATITFDELVDTIDSLPIERQIVLVDLIQHRLVEQRRQQIAQNAAEARALYQSGQLPHGTVDDFLADLTSDERS